jgi:XTP/dITP diphosphohydrolase
MKIIVSTQNPGKAAQIQVLLSIPRLEVVSLFELGILDDVEESGTTLEENAVIKTLFAHEKLGGYCVGEDTGLYIDALNGSPGIYAKRWAGESVTTEGIRNFVLEQLKNVPLKERTATFKTVAILITPDGTRHMFTGEMQGRILQTPRTACQPGLPYSSVFQPTGEDRVLSEMAVAEVNAISHRGVAFQALRNFLLTLV